MTGLGIAVNGFLTVELDRRISERRDRLSDRGRLWGTALRLLLVEDEPFIALDLQLLSTSAGHEVVGVADSLESALAMAADGAPQAALVDINLRDGFSGVQVSRRLAAGSGVAVGFVTGNAEQIPPDFGGAVAVLEKPFTQQGVEEMLSILQRASEGHGPSPATPRYAKLAPPQ